MSWADVENSVQEAIVKASGYPAERVRWSYQNLNEPSADHIRIHFGGEIVIGQDYIFSETDLTRANGQEILQEVRGVREVPLELECFTSAVLGDAAARRVLELTRTKLRLDSVRHPLWKAGVTPFDPGPVNYIPDIPSHNFRGRAICTIRCYIPVTDCAEYVGYIQRITGRIFPTGWSGPSGASGIPFDSDLG